LSVYGNFHSAPQIHLFLIIGTYHSLLKLFYLVEHSHHLRGKIKSHSSTGTVTLVYSLHVIRRKNPKSGLSHRIMIQTVPKTRE
ncbi:hypothetical protein, partial [Aneurinibacillus migulanus]|uniref:hypothetical protein n=1 Tax=Aneurinibacillus migulanus TaxID=47500 RepID=UPI001C48D099